MVPKDRVFGLVSRRAVKQHAVTPSASSTPGGASQIPPSAIKSQQARPSNGPATVMPGLSRRLRVLLLTNSVMMGGMERHVELLARHLDRQSFEVYTICPEWQAIDPFDRALSLVSDHHVRCTPDRRWGPWREALEVLALFRRIRSWRIDVLHLHLTAFNGGIMVLLAAHFAGVPVVICTEHLAPERPINGAARLLRALVTRSLDQLVYVSEKNRLARTEHLNTPSASTTVVVNGVDTADFPPVDPVISARLRQELQLPPAASVVGSVVRFTAEKGLDYLIAAMPAVLAQCPDAYFLLVGEGPLREDLASQAVKLGVRDRLVFAGFHPDPRPYLSLIDAFVLPVPVGSMSIGLLEAMAMQRAVIITFGGAGEAVVHEESGLWAPPRDPEALAQAITRVLTNRAEAHAFGKAARRRVEEEFSAASVARKLGTLYRRLYASRIRSRP